MDIYWEQWKDNDQFVDEDLSYNAFVLYFSFSNIQQIPWNWKKFRGLCLSELYALLNINIWLCMLLASLMVPVTLGANA